MRIQPVYSGGPSMPEPRQQQDQRHEPPPGLDHTYSEIRLVPGKGPAVKVRNADNDELILEYPLGGH